MDIPPSETPTPDTDGEWNRLAGQDHPEFERNLADFARRLERERDEAREKLKWRMHWVETLRRVGRKLRKERDEAIQARKDSAADWLNQVRNADFRVTRIKRERDEARNVDSRA
jgi:hypothetical protein